MKVKRSAQVERIGVHAVGKLVHDDLDWLFREQPVEDYGIDAHIELIDDDENVTGQLLAVQVRSRERPFDRISSGWRVRDSLEHLDYWLGHVLPVIMVIYDVGSERAYWQRVSAHTAVRTKHGFRIDVPESQPLDATARSALREIAARDDDRALEQFETMCGYLPPPCAEALRLAHAEDRLAASRLAQLLAEGRAEPSLTAQSVLVAPPRGMTETSWRLWQAVGSYAAEHEHALPGAQALERAATHADLASKARLFGLAACLLAQQGMATGDDDVLAEARRVIDATRDADSSSLLAELATAIVAAAPTAREPSWIPRRWQLPPAVAQLSEDDLRRDAMLSIAVGDDRLIAGDIDGAIERYRSAVKVLTNAGPKVKLAHALARRATSGAPLATADYDDAERLAREALVEYRRWAGPSESALVMLLHILLTRADLTQAIEQARMAPAGSALPREAEDEEVRVLGARAAIAAGQLDVAEELCGGVSDPLRRAQLDALRSEVDGEPAVVRAAWENVAELATQARDLTPLLVASHRLAIAGVWPLPGLLEADAAGVVPRNLVKVLAAVADAATGNVDRAIASLRPLAADDVLAVEHQAQILGRAGKVDQAVQVCLQGADRFQAPQLRFLASDLLLKDGRADEAASVLMQLLVSGAGSADAQRSMRLRLIEYAFSKGDWSAAEAYASPELGDAERTTDPPVGRPIDDTDAFAWALIGARFNRRELEAARAALDRYRPAVASAQQARVWLMLRRADAALAGNVDTALAIAEEWPHDAQLVSHVIATLVIAAAEPPETGGTAPELSEEQASRLTAIQTRYHAEFPAGALQLVQFDPDQFIDDMTARLQPIAELSAELHDKIRSHRLPVGVLASVSHRPYTLAVLTRPVGVTPAGTPFENDYDDELAAANRAIDRGIAVCEPSALYLTVLIDEHWPAVRGQFHDLLLPVVAYDDIVNTTQELVVPVAATMQYDPKLGRLVLDTPAPEVVSLVRERAAALEARAGTLTRVMTGPLTALPGQDAARDGPWLAPIQLAVDRGVPLYSDDVALRQLARSVGVESFGTLALIHALIERDTLPDVTEAILRSLAAEYVVDLPVRTELLVEIARVDDWLSGPALTIVSRARWWADGIEAASDFLDLMRRIASENADALGQWMHAGAIGVASGATTPEAKRAAIAGMTTLIAARVTGLNGPEFAAIIAAARQAAGDLGGDGELVPIVIAGLCAIEAELSGRRPDDPVIRQSIENAFAAIDPGDVAN